MSQLRSRSISWLLVSLFTLLSYKDRLIFFVLLLLMLATAAFEVLTLGLFLPLLTILSSGFTIDASTPYNSENYLSSVVSTLLGDSSISIFVLFFVLVVLITLCLRLFSIWQLNRFSARLATNVSSNAFLNIINKDFAFHASNNSSISITSLTTYVSQFVVVINNTSSYFVYCYISVFDCRAILA